MCSLELSEPITFDAHVEDNHTRGVILSTR